MADTDLEKARKKDIEETIEAMSRSEVLRKAGDVLNDMNTRDLRKTAVKLLIAEG